LIVAEPLFHQTCEYLAPQGKWHDECLPGTTEMHIKSKDAPNPPLQLHATQGGVPNATTVTTMEELEAGGGEQFENIEELFADMGV